MTTLSRILAAITLVNPTVVLAQPREDVYGPHMWGGGWGWWAFGHGMMALFWIVLIVLIVLAVRGLVGRPRAGGRPRDEALDILRQRFARGEIEQEEFEKRRQALEAR